MPDPISGVAAVNGAPDPAGGGLRQLALHERHAGLGARFAAFAGWEMPLHYGGIVAEHEVVRTRVGVFDVSHLARAWMRGPEAGARLRSVTTFDVTRLAEGVAHYSLYCNAAGGIEDDIFVYRLPGDRWLVVHNAANADADFALLEAVADSTSGVSAAEVTGETVMLAVQGPQAIALLTRVLGTAFAALDLRACAELDWRGGSLLVARTGYTGEDGAECIIAADRAAEIWDALVAAGAAPCGLGARDTLRLEAALPLHGHEIDAATNPFEAGLGFAVSLDDEAPFTGRAALEAAQAAPRTRRLAHVQATERGVLRGGYALHRLEGGGVEDGAAGTPASANLVGEPVGRLSSGAFSPTLRLGIGMAYLPVELATPGTLLAADVRGRALPVEVVRRPFYRRAE